MIRKGDTVYLSTRDGAQMIPCVVQMASENGNSLMLSFQAVVGFPQGAYVGMMPVLKLESGRWVEIVGSHEVVIKEAM